MAWSNNVPRRIGREQLSLVAAIAAIIILVNPTHAYAQAAGGGGDSFSVSKIFDLIIKTGANLDAQFNAVVSSGPYFTLCQLLLTAFAAIYIVIIVSQWMFNMLDPADVLLAIVRVAVGLGLSLAYFQIITPTASFTIALADAVQTAALGSSSPLAPVQDLFTIMVQLSGFKQPGGEVWDLIYTTLKSLPLLILILAVQFLFVLALLYITVYPMFMIFVAKILGVAAIPMMFMRQTSFLFDGWLRLFISSILYAFVARVVLVTMVIFIKAIFTGFITSENPLGGATDNIMAQLMIISVVAIAAYTLLRAEDISAMIASGTSTGIERSTRKLGASGLIAAGKKLFS
jgi:type IV secretory pathway VirB6-like protein